MDVRNIAASFGQFERFFCRIDGKTQKRKIRGHIDAVDEAPRNMKEIAEIIRNFARTVSVASSHLHVEAHLIARLSERNAVSTRFAFLTCNLSVTGNIERCAVEYGHNSREYVLGVVVFAQLFRHFRKLSIGFDERGLLKIRSAPHIRVALYFRIVLCVRVGCRSLNRHIVLPFRIGHTVHIAFVIRIGDIRLCIGIINY